MGDGQSKGGRGSAPCECAGGGFPASAGLPRGVRSWPCLPPSVLDSRTTLSSRSSGEMREFLPFYPSLHASEPHMHVTAWRGAGLDSGVRAVAACQLPRLPPFSQRATGGAASPFHNVALGVSPPALVVYQDGQVWAKSSLTHAAEQVYVVAVACPLPLYHSSYSDTLVLSALLGAVRASGRTVGCPCLSQAHVLHRPLCRW